MRTHTANSRGALQPSPSKDRSDRAVATSHATGMRLRLREAILADRPRLSREAGSLAKITIQDGTKGGRAGASAHRWIEVDDHICGTLKFAKQGSPAGSRNLVTLNESYLSVLREIVRPALGTIHAHNLKDFHEPRVAYARERDEEITQHRAPLNGGECCPLNPRLDHEAREQISCELGHRRIDVVAA